MRQYKLILASLLAVFMVACQPTVPDPDPMDTAGGDSSADTDPYDSGGSSGGEQVDYDAAANELSSIFYFDFDSAELRPEDTDDIAGHAMQLANRPGLSVRLEGHADERGSREYNIGLGERRSQTVRRMLLIQGASASQISTVSFGEERPAAAGSNEDAWAQNRRVEFIYAN